MVRSIYFRVALLALLAILSMAGLSNLQAADSVEAVRQQFVGDYELIGFVRFPAEGGEIESDYIGRIRYDEFGNMMAMGMPRDLPLEAEGATDRVTGGFSYWGRVSINPANNQVIHHVEGSPGFAQWVGQDNVRYYEFAGDLLKLSLKDANGRVTATLTWRRLK
jgi:hypothetical protein